MTGDKQKQNMRNCRKYLKMASATKKKKSKSAFPKILFLLTLSVSFSYVYFLTNEDAREKKDEFIQTILVSSEHREAVQKIERNWLYLPTETVVKDVSTRAPLTREGVVNEVNRYREMFGVNSLVVDVNLERVASVKMNKMFEEQYFDHISPTGTRVVDIVVQMTRDYVFVGDNLAMGFYRNDQELVKAWMNSLGHRNNILNERYNATGVALREGSYKGRNVLMVVQVFGASK